MDQAHKAMADREKEGKMEIQKPEYLKNEQRFLGEIKTTSIVFEELSFGEKKKKKKKKKRWANCYWTWQEI